MALKLVISEVAVDNIVKGKSRYSVANVVHTYNGESRTQKIISFANPKVFEQVQHLKAGDTIEVEVTKNDAGYNQWASLKKVNDNQEEQVSSDKPKPSAGKVLGSTYETKEERAARQVLIVKQSSLSSAIASFGSKVADLDEAAITARAQEFADWVFSNDVSLVDMPDDVPY